MSKKDIDVFLNKMKTQKEENKVDDKLFFEDKFLNRYQEMGYELHFDDDNQSGGGKNDYEKFTDEYDDDELEKQFDIIDKRIYHKHKTIFTSMINKFELKQMIERYVFHKYHFKLDSVFVIGSEMYIDRLKYDGTIYVNKMPNNIKKQQYIYIRIASNYREFKEYNQEMTDVIRFIMNNYIETNGNLIIFCPLLFTNKIFYYFFIDLINEFGSAEIFYPLYFMNHIINGFIILKKYKDNRKKITSIFNKLVPFTQKMRDFRLEEYNIYENLLTIKYNNETMFDIITQKYISYSMLKYDLDRHGKQ